MFKRPALAKFSICVFVTTFLIIALCCFMHFSYFMQIIGFAVVFSLINTYMVIGIFKNKFLAENEARERILKQQIEDSSYHLATIMNNLPLFAYVMDTNYNFITGNNEALKYFDIKGAGQFSKLSGDIFERDTMEKMKEEYEFILKSKKTFVTDRVIKLKNGKQNWFRIRKVPILDKCGENVNGFVVFGRNIDVERNAQKQRERYISTLSHDLKIPTIAQIRALELIVNESMGKINEGQKEILSLTLDSCYCMYDMLSTILTTYKYENNDIILSYEKIHMLKLLDDCFSKKSKEMMHKNIKVNFKAKDKFVSIYADEAQMRKAFENLVDFCVSSAYNDTCIICEMVKDEHTDSVFISLGFESPYVSAESIKNMFKMYTTSAEKLDKVGSSLNLYLAKQIINAHNGTIEVESSQSNYNKYNIEIPCIKDCKLPAIAC